MFFYHFKITLFYTPYRPRPIHKYTKKRTHVRARAHTRALAHTRAYAHSHAHTHSRAGPPDALGQ